MSSPSAIPPTASAPATASSGAPVTVTVVADAQGATANLPDGALLQAQANARAAKGVIELTTANGQVVQLKTPPGTQLPPIPEGATVLLQAQTSRNGELVLRLLAINGRLLPGVTLADLPAQLGQGGLSSPLIPGQRWPSTGIPGPLGEGTATQTPTQATPNPQSIATGAPSSGTGPLASAVPSPIGLTATVIRAGDGMTGPSAGLTLPLQPGATLAIRIALVGPPPTLPGVGTLPPGPQPPNSNIPSPAPQTGGTLPLPPGGVPSGGNSLAPPITTAPNQLPGLILAHPPGGQAVVQTPAGILSLPVPGHLVAGQGLVLDVMGKPTPPQASQMAATLPSPVLDADGWPALSQALTSLADGKQPQALEQLLRIIPQDNPRLAATIAAFAGGLKRGDTRDLIGETTSRGLEKIGKKELVEQLKGDLQTLSEQASRPVGGGEWRAYTMPFLNGGLIEPIRLFVRHNDADRASRPGGTGNDQRFVVDLTLSRLGRLQMDGLVRREDKLFDIIIRTDAPLPATMRHDILGLFANASELVGTKGSVSFQTGGRWLELPPDLSAPTRIEA